MLLELLTLWGANTQRKDYGKKTRQSRSTKRHSSGRSTSEIEKEFAEMKSKAKESQEWNKEYQRLIREHHKL